MKYYIAGPMRGCPEFNFPAFHEAERLLQGEDHTCFNPARRDEEVLGIDTTGCCGTNTEFEDLVPDLRSIIRADLEAVLESEAMYMLEGWERSVGARAEHAVAVWLGIPIEYEV